MRAAIVALEWVTRWIGYAAALIIIPLTLATCYEVFVRHVYGAPTIWAFELGYILMGVHFLLGGALALQHQAHVRIDLVYAQLSLRKRALIDLTLYVGLVLPCLVLLLNRLWTFAIEAFISGERTGNSAWNPEIWPFRFIIAASFIVLLLQIVAECLKAIQVLRGVAPPPTTTTDIEPGGAATR